MQRTQFAERISAGLSGWFQQLAAQDLQFEVGEEAARVELVRMISAQRTFVPETSRRPTNWPENDKKRIDLAVLGRREGSKGWYGAIELKWPNTAIDVVVCRRAIVQDALRVAFSQTHNMNARFVILGGTTEALTRVFDDPHPTAAVADAQRRAFRRLFGRQADSAIRSISHEDLLTHFPDALARIPPSVVGNWTRRLATELVATARARIGRDKMGAVYVWQCKK